MSLPRDANVISESPRSLHSGSPVRRRGSAGSDISDFNNRSRLPPAAIRSYGSTDPEIRERQRTMDVDMAMQLSRARRETVSSVGPAQQENSLPIISALSPQEQHEIDIARGERPHVSYDAVEEEMLHDNGRSSPIDVPHIHQAHDPTLLVSLGLPGPYTEGDDIVASNGGLPTYQANVSRSNFDFTPMEEFAAEEKSTLGISSPVARFPANLLKPRDLETASDSAQLQPLAESSSDMPGRPTRHRKISQSNPNPRVYRKGVGGKMALFEGSPAEPLPMLPARLGVISGGHATNVQAENVMEGGGTEAFAGRMQSGVVSGMGILNTGHDRPYRFSFYSNALSATIHARSLSELPAEGQSFEDLFAGIPSSDHDSKHTTPNFTLNPPPFLNAHNNGTDGPKRAPALDAGTKSGALKGALTITTGGQGRGQGQSHAQTTNFNTTRNAGDSQRIPVAGGTVGGGGDFEGNTWWLDIQNPTDEEMKMLSKVFSIHPLTTEDIQMEETREKIELFRNYYLVCFRSFDQDPYSPTHLEPLNMYIIVFREGTLSFHFRPTPHPQIVRRRIKQLKDYINVTSDWISYALIDDITDAFGPLIQSIEYEVDSIDELVLILKEAEQSDNMLRRIGTCRKKVMGLLRLMGNKADVVKGLAKRCNENWRVAPTSDIGLYLSDIQDHLITMTQNLNHYEKILSRSHSNYLAQISIEMTEANNQINDVLSKLTALGTVLIPMNLVTGIWGMNVHVPGQDVQTLTWFASIVACLAAFAIVGGYSTYRFMVRR